MNSNSRSNSLALGLSSSSDSAAAASLPTFSPPLPFPHQPQPQLSASESYSYSYSQSHSQSQPQQVLSSPPTRKRRRRREKREEGDVDSGDFESFHTHDDDNNNSNNMNNMNMNNINVDTIIDLKRIQCLHTKLKENLEMKLDDLKDVIDMEVSKYSKSLEYMKLQFNRYKVREGKKLAEQKEEILISRENLDKEWEALRYERRMMSERFNNMNMNMNMKSEKMHHKDQQQRTTGTSSQQRLLSSTNSNANSNSQDKDQNQDQVENDDDDDIVVEYKDDDIICINVGGKQMAVSRYILLQCEGSLLEAMFSGRWGPSEGNLKKDKYGNFFFDFDPYCFEQILDFLRNKALLPPTDDIPSIVPDILPNKRQCFNVLIDYLGLHRHMYPKINIVSFKWGQLHSHASLVVSENNEKIVNNTTNQTSLYGVCTPAMTSGSFVWKLQYVRPYSTSSRLNTTTDASTRKSSFIGVVATDYPSHQTFYGWGEKGSVWFCGHKIKSSNGGLPLCKPGDELIVKMDIPGKRLSMRVNNGNVFSIDNINNSSPGGLYPAIELGCGAGFQIIPLQKGEADF